MLLLLPKMMVMIDVVCTQPAADFMNSLDAVFKRRIFDDEEGKGGPLSTQEQLSCVALVWRVLMLSRC